MVSCTSKKDSDATGATAACCANTNATLGVNLEPIGPMSRSWTFVDVFKNSKPFYSIPSNQSLTLDADGWVTQLNSGQHAVTEILDPQGTASHYDLGPYTLMYDGTGTISVSGPVVIQSQTTGQIVFTLNSGATTKVLIDISQTNSSNYIKNIRVIMSGYESTYATQIFHPQFLTSLASFKVIRFLNWTMSNNSAFVSWSQRTKLTSQTQSSPYGVAPEHIVDLANRIKADLWINIPHLADDDAITQWATYIRDNLDPTLRVWVEHSNEIWGVFQQSTWAEAQGVALGLSSTPFTARIRFHAQRSVAIFNIFETVFGQGSPRVVRVLGASHTNTTSISEVMSWQSAGSNADVVATAPYFAGRLGTDSYMNGTASGYPYSKAIKNMTAAELVTTMNSESLLADAMTVTNYSLVSAQNLKYVTYEGGPALYFQSGASWATNSSAVSLFQSACRDSQLQTVALANMTRWRTSSNGGLYMSYVHINSNDYVNGAWYSCWGNLEYQTQDTASAPKWQALLDFLNLYPNP